MPLPDEDRITLRDDLDGLDDDETLVEDPDVRLAKTFLFLVVVGTVTAFVVVLLVFFQPEGVVMTESWPNGYPRTRATYVSAPNEEGRILHGEYTTWHQNGRRSAHGRYEQGVRVGEWRFWDETGELDRVRSGVYVEGEHVAPLAD